MYTLNLQSGEGGDTKRAAGFRLYDIDNVITKNDDLSYLLKSIEVGCQGHIDFSNSNQRLVYLSSYEKLEVVPVLHRNTIAFIGM